jgi:predicted nucleotidyltransferase
MSNELVKRSDSITGYRYQSPDIPLAAIRRFARQLATRFRPDRIILFGSYANGTPHVDSDVDLLVIMPTPNEVTQSIRMTMAFEPPFPLDLIVRTPTKMRRRLSEGDQFLTQIVTRGKVVYEARDQSLGIKSRSRSERRKRTGSSRAPLP